MSEPPEESGTQQAGEEGTHEEQGDTEDEARIPFTPGLVVLGLVAVALGLFAAVVMSAHTLAP